MCAGGLDGFLCFSCFYMNIIELFASKRLVHACRLSLSVSSGRAKQMHWLVF